MRLSDEWNFIIGGPLGWLLFPPVWLMIAYGEWFWFAVSSGIYALLLLSIYLNVRKEREQAKPTGRGLKAHRNPDGTWDYRRY